MEQSESAQESDQIKMNYLKDQIQFLKEQLEKKEEIVQ